MGICKEIDALVPLAQTACTLFLEECSRRGLRVFLTETFRSQARQNELYAQGRTKPGNIVTWTRKSYHTLGMAWDIAVCPPLELYDEGTLYVAGQVAQDLGIEWGGSWAKPDRVHFQICSRWEPPKEEVMRYQKLDDVPEWGKPLIAKMQAEGCFAEPELMNLSEDMLRVMVLLERHKEA